MDLFSESEQLELKKNQEIWIHANNIQNGMINFNLLSVSDPKAKVFLFAANERGEIVGLLKNVEDQGLHYGVIYYGTTSITVYSKWGEKNYYTLFGKSKPKNENNLEMIINVCFQFWYETNALFSQVYPNDKVDLSIVNKSYALSQAKFAIQLFSLLYQSRLESPVSSVNEWITVFDQESKKVSLEQFRYLESLVGHWKNFPLTSYSMKPYEKLHFFLVSDRDCKIEYRIFPYPVPVSSSISSLKESNLEEKTKQVCLKMEGYNFFRETQIEKLKRHNLTVLDLKEKRDKHIESFTNNVHLQCLLNELLFSSGFIWTNPFYVESIKNQDTFSRVENEWRMLDDSCRTFLAKTEDGLPCLIHIRQKDKVLYQENKRVFSIGNLLTIPTNIKLMHLCLGDPIVFYYKPDTDLLWIPLDQLNYLKEIKPSDL